MNISLPSAMASSQSLRGLRPKAPHVQLSLKAASLLVHPVLRSWLRWLHLLKTAISSSISSAPSTPDNSESPPSDPFMLPHNMMQRVRSSLTHAWPLLSNLSICIEVENSLVLVTPMIGDLETDSRAPMFGEEEDCVQDMTLLCLRCHDVRLRSKETKDSLLETPWEGGAHLELFSAPDGMHPRDVDGILRHPFPFTLSLKAICSTSLRVTIDSGGMPRGDEHLPIFQLQLDVESLCSSILPGHVSGLTKACRFLALLGREVRHKDDSSRSAPHILQIIHPLGEKKSDEEERRPSPMVGLQVGLLIRDISIIIASVPTDDSTALTYECNVKNLHFGITSLAIAHSLTFTVESCAIYRQLQR